MSLVTVTRLWILRFADRTIQCDLDEVAAPFALSITVDGTEIAARACASRSEAIGYATFVFERLSEAGWRVSNDGHKPEVVH